MSRNLGSGGSEKAVAARGQRGELDPNDPNRLPRTGPDRLAARNQTGWTAGIRRHGLRQAGRGDQTGGDRLAAEFRRTGGGVSMFGASKAALFNPFPTRFSPLLESVVVPTVGPNRDPYAN